jgi:diaminohydroxyphosphoribosylaminopyrimidine deaminase/5-amino-6-(5-phosphoribosylamino)uracil reductase
VCPIEDPNPLVSGRGFEVLRKNGIEVVTGVLKTEAERQNERFIHWHHTKRPFVHLKMAVSLDGKIATRTGDSKWITGPAARKKVQSLRYRNDAILVGLNTVLADNPSLTDRTGKPRNKKFVRVVLDNSLRLPLDSKVVNTAGEYPTIVFTDDFEKRKKRELEKKGVEVIKIEGGGRNLIGVLEELGKREIQGLLVEGGSSVAGSFFDEDLIDKISFFIAPKLIGGRDAPGSIGGKGSETLSDASNLKDHRVINHGKDLEITGYPH